jgi:membrane protein implicated in regulation of membrane protease activity
MKNWLKDFGFAILVWLTISFALFWLAYTIVILKNDPQLASAYVAVSTLILALITALMAYFTWLSIKSGEEREQRSKKERLLNEIIEWVEDVGRLVFEMPDIYQEEWRQARDIVSQFQVVAAKGDYIKRIALDSFEQDEKLVEAVEAVKKEFRELTDVSIELLDKGVSGEVVTEHISSVRLKISELLEQAARIKSEEG